MKLLLLPGMDGTGELFAPFVSAVSSWGTAQVVRYPTQECLTVDELVTRIELSAPTIVIAESFSGAVGIRLASRHSDLVKQLVLVKSFVMPPPLSGLLRGFGSLPFRVSPPHWALRRWLVGDDASDEFVSAVSRTLKQVSPSVLAHRLASISRIDERERLSAVSVPVMTLSGRQDRLVNGASRLVGREHFEIDGPHLLLQARPREAAELLHARLRSPAIPASQE